MLPYDFAREGIHTELNFPMHTLCTMKTGGVASLAVFPRTAEEFIFTVDTLRKIGCEYKVVGAMSNTLPPDERYHGVLVVLKKMRGVTVGFGEMTAAAGESLASLNRLAVKSLYSLSPELSGIPGTLGGAVRGNAGAYGMELSDILKCAAVYDADSRAVRTLGKEELHFGYRTSLLKKEPLYLLSATLRLLPTLHAGERIRNFASLRRASQPREPSLGSVFLRVDGVSAGALIDHAGLKGVSVGGAFVSEVHAGFIVNRGGATSRDVRALIRLVEERIYSLYGLRLMKEIDLM